MAKYKVFNNNDFAVGIRYENHANKEQVIPKNHFLVIEEDDIYYIDASSQLFRKGIIYLEDQDMLEKMGYAEKNPNTVSDKEIADLFKQNAIKIKTELNKIDAKHAKDKIIKVARQTDDLSQAKLKTIASAIDVEIDELIKRDEE